MNLRKAENYSIGLDLGTGSVGWAVVDEDGRLYHIKGRPTWGSRLFSGADTAAATRLKRGQRRRYERRRQRLDALQRYFFTEMSEIDPEFFVRLRQSRLLREDKDESIRDYRWPLFNGDGFTEAEYYAKYPTIYHLRRHLMTSNEKEDIRLIYLALHNIVKYRGNFLHEDEGESLKASNSNASLSATELISALTDYLDEVIQADGSISCDAELLERALDERGVRRGDRADAIVAALGPTTRESRNLCKGIARACVGYKVDFSKVFVAVGSGDTNFSLEDEEKAQAFVDEACPDEAMRLFEAIRSAYSAYVLSGILQGSSSISDAMVRSYELHQSDLKTLKGLFRDYLTHEQYNEFFRGAIDERGKYDINALAKGSYTSYIAGEKLANKKGTTHAELIKRIVELCESSSDLMSDCRYKEIEDRLHAGDESDFLAKQKTRLNGAIPYQLHLEEMDEIIKAQGKWHPFLLAHREEIEKLVSSRIPYYVGPLNGGHDPKGYYSNNNVDHARKYAWSVRKQGMEAAEAHPWNVDEVIDTAKTAELFIQRMTGTCTYLYGEPVLPRHSLLYEEFCVLNELNGARWGYRGGKSHRFDADSKRRIFDNLFRGRKSASVSYKLVGDWLEYNNGAIEAKVEGGQGESGFESKLSTYHDFCKVLNVRSLEDESPLSMDELEEIVLWNTVFEDRAIFRKKLLETYGPEGDGRLTVAQIKKIVNKRYTGWGRLSKKLLTGVRVPANTPSGSVSIMDVLRDGNPLSRMRQMVLMEVLSDKDLAFQEAIDKTNEKHFEESDTKLTVDDMQGSPANKRAVIQALRIVDEIVSITGKQPDRICIEVTRDDDWKKKGSRTRSRYAQLKEALSAFRADTSLLADLDNAKDLLDDDRLLLYFEQQGKCMYTEESLDINHLSDYQIDHILPQSFIKDDSISNRVLVKSRMNQRKLDTLLLDDAIIRERKPWWRALRDAGLITSKKYDLLTRTNLDERQFQGFINRQLVETSQVVKFVRQMCEQRYPASDVISVRASVSHGVRENLGLVKCRELNNFHHAHDAFLACQVADFVNRCYPTWEDGFSLALIRKYVKNLTGGLPVNVAPGKSGFIADSMTGASHIDEATGEIIWDRDDRCDYIGRALGYRDCFISRMTEIATGAFWDETVYSPYDARNGRNLTMPLKSSKSARNHEGYLDPSKYGGVSSIKQAYWFIFTAKDGRGRRKFFFEGVPIHLAGQVGDNLQEYADEVSAKANCGKSTILRQRVPLRQKLELDGTPYYLFGSTSGQNELRPVRELFGSKGLAQRVAQLYGGKELSDSELIDTYLALKDVIPTISQWLANVLQLPERASAFEALSSVDKAKQLQSIIDKLNGSSRTIDMRQLGGAKNAAFLRIKVAASIDRIVWIDQSVTGIFEKRTTFEDMCRGL